MRKFILRLTGSAYIVIPLFALAGNSFGGLFTYGRSYNFFMLVCGIICWGVADIGSDAGRWFDWLFALFLMITCITGAIQWANTLSSTPVYLGNILMNGIFAILLLYIGVIVNHRRKKTA